MFCIIQLKTIPNTYSRAKNNKKYIENNYYLLGMHAVFMGTTTTSCNGGGGEVSLPGDGVWGSDR